MSDQGAALAEPDPDPAAEPRGRPPGLLFGFAALAFLAAGVSHVVRGLAADPSDTSSPARHALFVLVNALAAAGLLVRPRWFVLPFAGLTAQQLVSHGGPAWTSLLAGAVPRLDDVAVVLGMPVLLSLLVVDGLRSER